MRFLLKANDTELFDNLCMGKQAKSMNETSSNLRLGTRLTRVKRQSRKRCCDTTPDRCQEGSRFTILFRIS